MTNYLYYDYATSRVCKIQEQTKTYEAASSLDSYFNQICIEHGSTMEGRKKAYSIIMNQTHFIPIVIDTYPHWIFFPISAKNDPNNIWICYENIEYIEYKKKTCTIHFLDHTCLTVEHPKRIKTLMQQIFLYIKQNEN